MFLNRKRKLCYAASTTAAAGSARLRASGCACVGGVVYSRYAIAGQVISHNAATSPASSTGPAADSGVCPIATGSAETSYGVEYIGGCGLRSVEDQFVVRN